jgi:hypothetical protein
MYGFVSLAHRTSPIDTYILFSDEASFMWDGVNSMENACMWSAVHPHVVYDALLAWRSSLHCAQHVGEYLHECFPDHWIGHGTWTWPPRSLNFISAEYFLWGSYEDLCVWNKGWHKTCIALSYFCCSRACMQSPWGHCCSSQSLLMCAEKNVDSQGGNF